MEIPAGLGEPATKAIKETFDYLHEKLQTGSRTDRAGMAAAIAENDILSSPINALLQEWINVATSVPADKIVEERAKVEKRLIEKLTIIRSLAASLSPDDAKTTLETLAKAQSYGNALGDLLMASEKNPQYAWVKDAVKFIFSAQTEIDPGTNPIGEMVKALTGHRYPDPNFAFSCTLMAFAKPQKRKDIIDKCLESDAVKKMDVAQKQELFKALCEKGAVSPLEVDEAIGPKAGATPEEEAEWGKFLDGISVAWEEKYDFMQEAKRLCVESYGAKNAANEMFTLSGFMRLFGYVAGSATVLLNWIVNFKEIKKDPSYAFKIPHVLFGLGEIGAAAIFGSDKSIGELLASKETRDTQDHNKALEGLLKVVSASPRGWKSALEMKDPSGDSFGVKTLASFVSEKNKDNNFQENEATFENFKLFLENMKKEDPTKPYDQLLAQLKKVESNEGNADLTGTRFKKLAFAFAKLNIGPADNAGELYQEALVEAKQGPTNTPKEDTSKPAATPTAQPVTPPPAPPTKPATP
jgi:hypothetical protein